MTITLTREEAQQVLDALANAAWCVQRNNLPPDDGHDWDKEIELLRARLAQPEPEPVAWYYAGSDIEWHSIALNADLDDAQKANCTPLYTAPPQREWQGLTDEELRDIFDSCQIGERGYVAAMVEAKLKEKNT